MFSYALLSKRLSGVTLRAWSFRKKCDDLANQQEEQLSEAVNTLMRESMLYEYCFMMFSISQLIVGAKRKARAQSAKPKARTKIPKVFHQTKPEPT